MRTKRFRKFEALTAGLPRPIRILDIGGTNEFWRHRGWAGRDDIQIVTLNLFAEERIHDNIRPVAGDATDLGPFASGSFDVAFSNSVIEHLFTFQNQKRMASEIQRVGKAFWVQTPNFWFPMEPHFHVPGWQWMPTTVRSAMLQRWRCGWRGPCPDPSKARELVKEVRLLTGTEMRKLFPGSTLLRERFGGMTKSWIAIGGFPTSAGI
jgi:hypothetical protein